MKNEPCPNCGGMLGVPDKLRGLSVECPVCQLKFVPGSNSNSRQNETNAAKSSSSIKPSLRSVPLPASISSGSDSATAEKVKLVGASVEQLVPPNKPRLTALSPESKATGRTLEQAGSMVISDADNGELETHRRGINESGWKNGVSVPGAAENKQPAVARIIKTESVQPQLTKDGKLPTLQLVDEAKPKAKDGELKTNPVFVGLLVCFSLLTSGVMLFVVGMQPSESAKQVLNARENIREFYEVRMDEEVAPFQRELREAQLANSRGDFKTEIRNYEKVMGRFHAEDRNRFKGLTGTPSGDLELEEYVAILLNEAKRRLRSGR